MGDVILEELYGRFINRAKRLGLGEFVKDLTETKQSGKFDYEKFIEHCRKLGINPVLALSDNFKEADIKFRLNGLVELVKVVEELTHILSYNGLLKKTKISPMTDFYKSLVFDERINDARIIGMVMAEIVRKVYGLLDCPNLFDFCRQNHVYLLYLTEKAPVEGFFATVGDYLLIAVKKGYVPRMHWALAHELGHFFMGHENLDLDKGDWFRSVKKDENSANWFANYLTTSLTVGTPTPECCMLEQAFTIRFGKHINFEPNCVSMDVSGYALNELLNARKEDLFGEEGSFYQMVKEYVWGV